MEQAFSHPKLIAADAPDKRVVRFPEDHVDLVSAYLRGLPSDATRAVYGNAIRQFADFLGDSDLLNATRRDVEAFRSHLEVLDRAPATIAKIMAALTGVFAFALDEGAVQVNPAARARRPKVPTVSLRQGLSPAEVKALLSVLDLATPIDLRDRVLLLLLAVQAWRLSEVLGLRIEDLGEEGGHKVAVVHGKGSKVIRVPLAASTWVAIQEWTAVAGLSAGPVIVPVLKGGRVQTGRALSAQSSWKRITVLAGKAGIGRRIHPHLFRHGAVTQALAAGVPLHQVQDFARHADPRTTRRYDSHRMSLSNPACHVLASRFADDASCPEPEPRSTT